MDISKLVGSLCDMASFVVVVEEGDFSAASRKLGVTPSAVSRQITRLEDKLAMQLLERTTRKMVLSVQAKPVYDLCKTMLESAQAAIDISNQSTVKLTGLIRIAAPKAVAKHILEPMLLGFAKQYPLIELQIKVTDFILNPIDNEVDLIIAAKDLPDQGLIAKELGKVQTLLCASPDYIAQHTEINHPSDLSNHSCITLGESANDHILEWHKGAKKLRVNVKGRYKVNHSQMRLNAMLSGLGVGVVPDFIATQALQKGDLIQLLPSWQLKHNYQGVLRLQYAQSKFIPERLRLLVAYLVTNYKESML